MSRREIDTLRATASIMIDTGKGTPPLTPDNYLSRLKDEISPINWAALTNDQNTVLELLKKGDPEGRSNTNIIWLNPLNLSLLYGLNEVTNNLMLRKDVVFIGLTHMVAALEKYLDSKNTSNFYHFLFENNPHFGKINVEEVLTRIKALDFTEATSYMHATFAHNMKNIDPEKAMKHAKLSKMPGIAFNNTSFSIEQVDFFTHLYLLSQVKEDSEDEKKLLSNLCKKISLGIDIDVIIENASIFASDQIIRLPTNTSALLYAVRNCSLNVVNCLLDNGADPEIEQSFTHWRPIHYAAKGEDSNILKALMDNGADVNALTIEDYTPILVAALNDCDHNVVLLASHKETNINYTIGENLNIFNILALVNSKLIPYFIEREDLKFNGFMSFCDQIIKYLDASLEEKDLLLLEEKNFVITILEKYNISTLSSEIIKRNLLEFDFEQAPYDVHMAFFNEVINNLEIHNNFILRAMRHLILAYYENANDDSIIEKTLLIFEKTIESLIVYHSRIAREVIQIGNEFLQAHPINTDTTEKATIHILEVLFKNGLNINEFADIDVSYYYNLSLNHGDVTKVSTDKITLLHFAARHASGNIFEYLLTKNPNTEAKTSHYSLTPLLVAVYSNKFENVLKLKSSGADFKATSNTGDSVLFGAIYSKDIDFVKYLINENDTNINYAAFGFLTAFCVALLHNEAAIANLISQTPGYSFKNLAKFYNILTKYINKNAELTKEPYYKNLQTFFEVTLKSIKEDNFTGAIKRLKNLDIKNSTPKAHLEFANEMQSINLDTAIKSFKIAAEAGETEALVKLAAIYLDEVPHKGYKNISELVEEHAAHFGINEDWDLVKAIRKYEITNKIPHKIELSVIKSQLAKITNYAFNPFSYKDIEPLFSTFEIMVNKASLSEFEIKAISRIDRLYSQHAQAEAITTKLQQILNKFDQWDKCNKDNVRKPILKKELKDEYFKLNKELNDIGEIVDSSLNHTINSQFTKLKTKLEGKGGFGDLFNGTYALSHAAPLSDSPEHSSAKTITSSPSSLESKASAGAGSVDHLSVLEESSVAKSMLPNITEATLEMLSILTENYSSTSKEANKFRKSSLELVGKYKDSPSKNVKFKQALEKALLEAKAEKDASTLPDFMTIIENALDKVPGELLVKFIQKISNDREVVDFCKTINFGKKIEVQNVVEEVIPEATIATDEQRAASIDSSIISSSGAKEQAVENIVSAPAPEENVTTLASAEENTSSDLSSLLSPTANITEINGDDVYSSSATRQEPSSIINSPLVDNASAGASPWSYMSFMPSSTAPIKVLWKIDGWVSSPASVKATGESAIMHDCEG